MLTIKSITTCNLNTTPLYSSNVSNTIYEYKDHIKNIYNDYNVKEDELIINCVNGIYGYRCGLLGYLSNLLSYKLSEKRNPQILQSLLNRCVNKPLYSNDYELLSFFISFVCRKIPILNIGFWDIKNKLFNDNELFKNNIVNNSNISILNLNSTYLLRPLFDSGSAIYSNKKYIDCGYEPWDTNNRGYFKQRLFNKGLVWAFYESKNKSNGIAIINIDMTDDAPDWIYLLNLKQIIRMKQNLQKKFLVNDNYEKYETFIIGDFKSEFNLCNILPNIKRRWKIFESANLVMYNKISDVSGTNFIFYNDYYGTNKINLKSIKNIKNDNFSLINLELDNEFDNELEKNICKLEHFYRKQRLRNYIHSLKEVKKFEDVCEPEPEPEPESKPESKPEIVHITETICKPIPETKLKEIVITNTVFKDHCEELNMNNDLCISEASDKSEMDEEWQTI